MTIFPSSTIDRAEVKLEEHIYALTPVEDRGIFFKREDYFAPLGYGGVNGSKLRQLIWLIHNYTRSTLNPSGVISGAVSGSPQHVMAAIVCKHYGLKYIGIVGAKTLEGKPGLKLAVKHGAELVLSPVGYAKTLESTALKMIKNVYPRYFFLETNIVVNKQTNSVERVKAFHSIGGRQVRNIPDHIEDLIIPCGSATSTISILYGLNEHGYKNLKRIILMGIGNVGSNDLDFIFRRLALMGVKLREHIEIVHYNLNGTGFCKYEDLMPFIYEGIHFHPRYEGKCIKYLYERHKEHFNNKTLFWIVGSEAKK